MNSTQIQQSLRLKESIQDTTDDIAQTIYLLNDLRKRIHVFLARIKKVQSSIHPNTLVDIRISADGFVSKLDYHHRRMINTLRELQTISSTEELQLYKTRDDEALEYIRIHQQQIAALIVSTDWQSPSFEHTRTSRAGRLSGSIYPTINDYKRDRHEDAYIYERLFVQEYVDSLIKFPIFAYAVSSGMAAFTTILNFLLLEKKAVGPVIIGESIWFQNKILLQHAYKENHILVNEQHTQDIVHTIIKHKPTVLFFDSLENSPEIIFTDIEMIIKTLVRHATAETYLVIDNTCLGMFLQPMKYILGKRSKVKLILFESLNKYHQFGLDRTTGGIIWSYGKETAKLFDYRVHLGTNIPDVSALSLPTPNRIMMSKRLMRYKRNIMVVTLELQRWIDSHPSSPFRRIVYPGLPNHPSHAWAMKSQFQGSFFSIEFKQTHQSIPVYKNFVEKLMKNAKKYHVDLTSGTSFGLNHTRIYLTAIKSSSYKPFIRISVGTQQRTALESLISAIIKTMEKFV